MVMAEHRGRQVEQATRCECIRRQQGGRLLEAARIPRRYRHCELSNFEHEGPFRSLAPAHMGAMRFVEEYPLESAGAADGANRRGQNPFGGGNPEGVDRAEERALPFSTTIASCSKEIQNSYNNSVKVTEMDVLAPDI